MYYSDYVESLDCYGVFHTENDFCFSTWSNEENAELDATERNNGN